MSSRITSSTTDPFPFPATYRILPGHDYENCKSLALSPDNNTLYTASERKITAWDTKTGAKGKEMFFKPNASLKSLHLSPDGTTLFAPYAESGAIAMFSAQTGELLGGVIIDAPRVGDLRFSQDGKTLVCGDANVCFTGTMITSPACRPPSLENIFTLHHRNGVHIFCLSPEGSIFSVEHFSKTIFVWEPKSITPTTSFKAHDEMVSCLHLSSTGETLFSGSHDRTIKVWKRPTQECTHTLKGHMNCITTLELSPDDKWLFSGSYDGNIKIWDIFKGSCLHTLTKHMHALSYLRVNSSGTTLYSATKTDVYAWDIKETSMTHVLAHPYYISACFSSDGKTLFLGGTHIQVCNVETGESLKTLLGHRAEINYLYPSCDGTTLFSASRDGTVKAWDIATGACKATLVNRNHSLFALCFSSDATVLFFADSVNNTIHRWDLKEDRSQESFGVSHVSTLCLSSPEDLLLFTGFSTQEKIKVWDAKTGACLRTFAGGEKTQALSFSPSQKLLFSVSEIGMGHVWNTETGACLATFPKDMNPNRIPINPYSLCLSSDERLLFFAKNASIIVWEIFQEGGLRLQEKGILPTQGSAKSLFPSPDGKTLVSTSEHSRSIIWELGAAVPERQSWALPLKA